MGVCTAFVFAALVEFTFVNYMWRKSMSHPQQQQPVQNRPKKSSTFFTCLDKQGDIELDMVSFLYKKIISAILPLTLK